MACPFTLKVSNIFSLILEILFVSFIFTFTTVSLVEISLIIFINVFVFVDGGKKLFSIFSSVNTPPSSPLVK